MKNKKEKCCNDFLQAIGFITIIISASLLILSILLGSYKAYDVDKRFDDYLDCLQSKSYVQECYITGKFGKSK